MKKHLLISVFVAVLIMPAHASARSVIYDSVREQLYFGGYVFDEARRVLKEKPTPEFEKEIYTINVQDGKVKLLLQADEGIIFFEKGAGEFMAAALYQSQTKKQLGIFNLDGEKMKTIDDVPVNATAKYFSWSPRGDKIVFIRGKTLVEGKNIPFEPLGTWIYDVKQNVLKKISNKGMKVEWSRHDDKVYILRYAEAQVVDVYDPSTGELILDSPYNGIVFSTDGKYYFGKLVTPDAIEFSEEYFIYDANTNKPHYQLVSHSWENARFINSRMMLSWNSGWGYKVIDIEEKKRLRLGGENRLLGWNQDMTKAIVYDGGGKQIHIEELLTGKRLKSLSIPGQEK